MEDRRDWQADAGGAGEVAGTQLLLSPVQAARRLGIGRSTLYLLLADGSVESVHVGARRLIPAEALVDYVERLRAGKSAASSARGGTLEAPTDPPAPRRARPRSDSQPTLPLSTWAS
jgi:excisionase family DNA binding protein